VLNLVGETNLKRSEAAGGPAAVEETLVREVIKMEESSAMCLRRRPALIKSCITVYGPARDHDIVLVHQLEIKAVEERHLNLSP